MRKSHIVLIAVLTAVTFGLAGCSHVGDDWKAAQTADTTEAYQDFLHQHPDSEFSVPAQERLKQLAEDRDWQQASKTDTLDAYQQFVAAHADGKWAQEARVRIENFQLTASGQAPAAAAAVADGSAAAAAPAGGPPDTAPPVQAAAQKPTDKPLPAAPASVAKPSVAKPSVVASTKPAAPHKTVKAAKSTAGHSVASAKSAHHLAQLGAYGSRASAEAAWHKLAGRFPGELKSLQPHYASVTPKHGKPMVRLQVTVASKQRAHDLCSALKKKSQPCVPLG